MLKTVHSINGVGKNWTDKCRKMELDHLVTPHRRINAKKINDLNVRSEAIKTVEENISNKILDTVHSDILSGISPQARETKEKINKRDYIKLKRFCTAKDFSKLKRNHQQNKKTTHRKGEHICQYNC